MDNKQLLKEMQNLLNENEVDNQVAIENELADNKRKLHIYQKAYLALEELEELLEDGRNPLTDKLDPETDAFYDRLVDIVEEIHSRSLAFEV